MLTKGAAFVLFFALFAAGAFAQPNLALSATASFSGGGSGTYGPANLNDQVIVQGASTYGWVSCSGYPNTGWMQYEWTSPQTIAYFTFYSDLTTTRYLRRATIEWWDGSSWQADSTYLQPTPYNVTYTVWLTQPRTTTRLRLYSLDTVGSQASNPNCCEWQVFGPPGLTIITSAILPTGAENTPYSTTVQADFGQVPYIWNTTVSGLPPGITASQAATSNDLVLSGTPTQAGTYNFSLTVTDSDTPPDNETKAFQLTIMPPPAAMPFTDDFSSNLGWQLGAGWQIGSATAYTGTGPNRTEPGSDYTPTTDNNILGHNIGGDYTNSMPETYAVSPPVNCSTATVVHLRFYRWLGVASGDWAKIQVTNNGSTWTDVYSNGGTASVNTPSDWEAVAYDLTSVAAGNGVVQVRFQLGTSDTSIVNVGWCIDDFQILDPGPPMLVEEGGTGGTPITDAEPVGGLRDWGMVPTGTNSSVLTIAFTNNGLSPITFGSYSKTGANPTQFYVTKQITVNPLPVGQTDTIQIQFNSPNAGVHTCTFNQPHNVSTGAGTSPFEINLRAEAFVPVPDLEVRLGSATGPTIAHNDPAAGTPRDFGQQDVNAGPTAAITLTIVNAGTGSLSLSTPDMGGSWWNQFVVTVPGTFPSVLPPGSDASFEVAFDPSSAGIKDAFVRIVHLDTTKPSPYQIPVLGEGISTNTPVFSASDGAGTLAHNDPPAGPRDFGNVQVGTTAGPITITITNSGGQDLILGNPTLGGPNPGEFALNTAAFASPVTGGNSTSFDVTFTPTSVGQKDATISITHNDMNVTSPFIINVTGNGVTTAPTASVHIGSAGGPTLNNPAPATGPLDFGQWDYNSGPTASVVIYVENTGTAPLTLAAPTVAGPDASEFVVLNAGSFAGTFNPGDPGVTFEIAFDPSSVGIKTANVRFIHNDTTTGSPFVINVTGEGILNSPLIEVREGSQTGTLVNSGQPAAFGGGRDCGSIDVSAGASAPITVVVVNAGTLDLNLGTPTLSGPNAGSFVLNTAGFTAVVAPGSNTSFQVTFDPNLGGIKDAQVEFTQDDSSKPTPYVVPVRGTAVDPGGVQITTGVLPAGASGQDYTPTQMQAINGAAPYTWSVYSGNIPAGLNFSAGGLLDGNPTGYGGSFDVTIRVTDANSATHERAYKIVVTGTLTGSGRAKNENACAAESGSSPYALLGVIAILGAVALVRRKHA